MIIYKCDGERFSDRRKCESVHEARTADDFPNRWLTLNSSIENGLPNSKLIKCIGTFHFCSRTCFELFIFKDEPIEKI